MSVRLAPVVECRTTEPGANGEWKQVLTHIEIRRVQNGFVLMGINAAPNMSYGPEEARRVCFVCETVESLINTISSLCTDRTGGFCWAESYDIPITGLFEAVKR